jgi:serine/threonine-protein kinase RsbW
MVFCLANSVVGSAVVASRPAISRRDDRTDELPSAMRASITLRSENVELTRLQTFADEFAHECGLPEDERSRLLVILEELFTNAVMHGHGPYSAGGSIIVALDWRSGHLRISFVDDAPPFDPLAFGAPDLDAAGEERPVGGLGIHIVRSLVDHARYRRKGGRNHLHLVRHIAPATRNAVPTALRQR